MSEAETTRIKNGTSLDWSRFDVMTDEERHAAALADPDAQPLSDNDMDALPRRPQTAMIYRALHS